MTDRKMKKLQKKTGQLLMGLLNHFDIKGYMCANNQKQLQHSEDQYLGGQSTGQIVKMHRFPDQNIQVNHIEVENIDKGEWT